MTIASDLGLLVGDRIKVIDPDMIYGNCWSDQKVHASVLELVEDDGSVCPYFINVDNKRRVVFTVIDRTDNVSWVKL